MSETNGFDVMNAYYLTLIRVRREREDFKREMDYIICLNDDSKIPCLNIIHSLYEEHLIHENNLSILVKYEKFPEFTKHQKNELQKVIDKKNETLERYYPLKYNPSKDKMLRASEQNLKESLLYLVKSLQYKLDAMYELYLIQNINIK